MDDIRAVIHEACLQVVANPFLRFDGDIDALGLIADSSIGWTSDEAYDAAVLLLRAVALEFEERPMPEVWASVRLTVGWDQPLPVGGPSLNERELSWYRDHLDDVHPPTLYIGHRTSPMLHDSEESHIYPIRVDVSGLDGKSAHGHVEYSRGECEEKNDEDYYREVYITCPGESYPLRGKIQESGFYDIIARIRNKLEN